jgi:hypothetical protein
MHCIGSLSRGKYDAHPANGLTTDHCDVSFSRARRANALASQDGRLATFPSPQDAASVTTPWDPGRKSWGDGRRRPIKCNLPKRTEKRYQQKASNSGPVERLDGFVGRRNSTFLAHEHAQTRSQPIAQRINKC